MRSMLDVLLEEKPSFHRDSSGAPASWSSNVNMLKDLDDRLVPGMKTLEIGSGYSTAIFIANNCTHTIITPSEEEVLNITKYCVSTGLEIDKLSYQIGSSHRILPNIQGDYDLIFIDGAHRFPFPMTDWLYCSELLKIGGTIIIDDTDIISCHILLQFMISDDNWCVDKVYQNYALFKKVGDVNKSDWAGQKFSKNKTTNYNDLLKIFGYDIALTKKDETAITITNSTGSTYEKGIDEISTARLLAMLEIKQDRINALLNSKSWKLTKPLRIAHEKLGKLFR